jgi:hypothetical protein
VNTRRLLLRTGLLALLCAYPFAVILGPREGLGVLLAAAVAAGNFLLMGRRFEGTARTLSQPVAPDPKVLVAKGVIGGGIRWLVTFVMVWGLLKHHHALAVVAGLSCVVGSITLQALSEYLRAEREPSAGAGK